MSININSGIIKLILLCKNNVLTGVFNSTTCKMEISLQIIILKDQYPVTAHAQTLISWQDVANSKDARSDIEPSKIRLHRAQFSSILP